MMQHKSVRFAVAVWVAGLFGMCAATGFAQAPARKIEFSRDIQPLLSETCFNCHGPDAAKRKGWVSTLNGIHLKLLDKSWEPTTDGINTGLVLYSRNVLNTLGVVAGPTYNFDEGTVAFDAGASYAGLPVIVDAAARVGRRAFKSEGRKIRSRSFQHC